jgi:hypothetical protein
MVCLLQVAYDQEMVAQHGDGFNWWGAPIDVMVVYNSGGGKPYGRRQMSYFDNDFA